MQMWAKVNKRKKSFQRILVLLQAQRSTPGRKKKSTADRNTYGAKSIVPRIFAIIYVHDNKGSDPRLFHELYSSCSLSSLALSYHCHGTKLSCWPFLLSRACRLNSCLLLNTLTKSLALALDSLLRFLLWTKSYALQLRSHEEDDGMAASTLIATCLSSGANLQADTHICGHRLN